MIAERSTGAPHPASCCGWPATTAACDADEDVEEMDEDEEQPSAWGAGAATKLSCCRCPAVAAVVGSRPFDVGVVAATACCCWLLMMLVP